MGKRGKIPRSNMSNGLEAKTNKTVRYILGTCYSKFFYHNPTILYIWIQYTQLGGV